MSGRTRGLLIGFVAGAVTATAWPLLGALASDLVRPLGKALMKHGVLGAERLRVVIARASEALEDLVAEVRGEVEAELAASDGRGPRPSAAVSGNVPAPTRGPRTGSSNLS